MSEKKLTSAEARALERVASVAREVQAASRALEKHFADEGGTSSIDP